MRDTTKIKAIAEETIADLNAAIAAGNSVTTLRTAVEGAIENQKEIANIAKRMDARTGTTDPSTKGPKSGTDTRPAPGRE